MPLTIDEQFRGLSDTISSAQSHFDVWEAFENSRTDVLNVRVLNKYIEFFRAATTGNFESYIISCYQLLETKDDRICFPSLKRDLLASRGIDIETIPEVTTLQQEMRVTWISISTLRNKHVGHLSRNHAPRQVYEMANLQPAQVRQYIENAKTLYNLISSHCNDSIDAFNLRGGAAVERLLADLRVQL